MNISQKKLEKSKGRLEIKIKDQNLQKLYQQGSLKALMPDFHENLKQLMLINTAGGITSGDEYNYDIEINKSNLCISTQAAEKIYSGFGDPANLVINLNLSNNSSLFWLPKELILFNNCNFKRKIKFNLSTNSNLLLCENIIFGRTSMKEEFEKGYFSDFWNINVDNKLIHTEAINTNLFDGAESIDVEKYWFCAHVQTESGSQVGYVVKACNVSDNACGSTNLTLNAKGENNF